MGGGGRGEGAGRGTEKKDGREDARAVLALFAWMRWGVTGRGPPPRDPEAVRVGCPRRTVPQRPRATADSKEEVGGREGGGTARPSCRAAVRRMDAAATLGRAQRRGLRNRRPVPPLPTDRSLTDQQLGTMSQMGGAEGTAYIFESFEAAPPVTLATRSDASSDFSSSSCLTRSFLPFVRSSCTLIFMVLTLRQEPHAESHSRCPRAMQAQSNICV